MTTTPPAGPFALGARLRWMLVPLAIGAGSRLFAIIAIVWADWQRPDLLPNPFIVWDGLWYRSIAETGYHAYPIAGSLRDIAFFPAWPMLMRYATLFDWHVDLVGPILANVLFVVACVLVWRVLADRIDARTATVGVLFLAFSPAAYVASLAYSEPLFLVLAASAFLLGRRTVPRAVAVAAAMATRIAGAALVLLEVVRAARTRGRERARHLFVAGAGIAAFAGWWVFLAVLMNDPIAFLHGSPSWLGATGLASFAQALSFRELPQVVALAFLVVLVGASVAMARRDRELGLYALACLAMTLLPGGLVSSSPRYALSAFPAFAGLAIVLRGRLANLAFVVMAAGEVLWTYWMLVERRAP